MAYIEYFANKVMIEFPALLRTSQQKGERNAEYFQSRVSSMTVEVSKCRRSLY